MQWPELLEFRTLCEAVGLTPPEPITRGIHLRAVAADHETAPPAKLLDLTDDEARERVTDLALRAPDFARGTTPMGVGVSDFQSALVEEVRQACLPHLDDLVAELQPEFEETTRPLVTAARTFGFTNSTTPAQVLDLADEEAADAYRGSRQAIAAIMPIVRFRIALSRIFLVSPTIGETLRSDYTSSVDPLSVNHSIAFAEGDNWSDRDGYYLEGKAGRGHIDWLALAAGGLRLNTPTETRMKLLARPGLWFPHEGAVQYQ